LANSLQTYMYKIKPMFDPKPKVEVEQGISDVQNYSLGFFELKLAY